MHTCTLFKDYSPVFTPLLVLTEELIPILGGGGGGDSGTMGK